VTILAALIAVTVPIQKGVFDPARAAAQTAHRHVCMSVSACRRALTWQRRDRARLRHQLAVRFHRDSSFAIDLAARAFGISEATMRRVSFCESRFDPFATNGQYRGLFQIGPRINSTPFAGLNPYDPLVNALAAGAIVRQDGGSWREWSCG